MAVSEEKTNNITSTTNIVGAMISTSSTKATATATNEIATPILSISKQRAVDEAFYELFGKTFCPSAYNNNNTITHGASTSTSSKRRKIKKNPKKTIAASSSSSSKRLIHKKKRILSDLFGTSFAMKLISNKSTSSFIGGKTATSNSNNNSNLQKNNNERKRNRQENNDNTNDPKYYSIKKKIVTETKVFAGQTVEIQRTVLETNNNQPIINSNGDDNHNNNKKNAANGTSSTNTISKSVVPIIPSSTPSNPQQQQQQPKKQGIDAVLEKINGPQKITTMDKTNFDWEQFKDSTGLEDELKRKAQSNDAYLVKKDFLNRVDVRRFEQEKEERNKQRAANAASSQK